MRKTDVLVIGAGPAGAVASAWLKQNGYETVVLEKTKFPRFVIGESLLPHCMDHLDEVGFLPALKAHGFQLKNGAVFYKGDNRQEFLFSDQHTDGWSWTWQVKRADFDQILINESIKNGVEVQFETEVTAFEPGTGNQRTAYSDKSGKSSVIESRFLIDASGYGRVLPRLLNLEEPVVTPPRSAVFVHVKDSKRDNKQGQNIFIHSFRNNSAWIWAIPFSDQTTSVGVVSDTDFVNELFEEKGKGFLEILRNFHELKGRFSGEDLIFEPRTVQNYAVRAKTLSGPGFVMCGNATEFLDPIFSSGVTLATGSGLMAAKLTDKYLKGEKVDWLNGYEQILRNGVDVFRSFVQGWYSGDMQNIFFAQGINPQIKKQITSILAGYVWDESNPFVKKRSTLIQTLSNVITAYPGHV